MTSSAVAQRVSSRTIHLAADFQLPLDVVTETVAILAKRRAGKSYTARKLVEQLLDAQLQVVVVDPKGDWWGLRSSADGKTAGYPILIAGGEHGDVPLEASGGEVLARFVVEQRVNLLLDLSSFRKHEVSTFMTAFMETLYRLKAQEQHRTPMMLAIDEADAIAPQRPQKGEERMLGAAEDIVRRGGQRGIGCTLISQRSAVLNKNVLTQAQVLVALRTMSPQDLAALDAWIEVHGSPVERKVLFDSLPSLPVGDAWVWSPGWPDTRGIFTRIHVDRITTFDSGATPKVGQKISPPKSVAEVDLGALKEALAETIERAKADDPRELRRQISALQGQLRTLKGANERLEKLPSAVQHFPVPFVPVEVYRTFEQIAEQIELLQPLAEAIGGLKRLVDTGRALLPEPGEAVVGPTARSAAIVAAPSPNPTRTPKPAPSTASGLTTPQQRIIDAISTLESLGMAEPNRATVAAIAGFKQGGYFNNTLSTLRTNGLVIYPAGSKVALTQEGRDRVAEPPAVHSLEDLHNAWRRLLDAPQQRILNELIAEHPVSLSRAELAERAGFKQGGYFNNTLSSLRTMGLINYPSGGEAIATDLLFPEELVS